MIGILGLAALQPWVPRPPNTIKIRGIQSNIRIKNTFKPFQGENGISDIQTKFKLKED